MAILPHEVNDLPFDYYRSTTALPTQPLARYVPPTAKHAPPTLSGAILLVVGLLVLWIALSHIGASTDAQAVAWAFVVAGVLAALRRWA